MSAATSGFELPLVITNISEADNGFEVGRRLRYVRKFCSAQPLFSEWQITKLTDSYVEVKPLRTLHVDETRRLTIGQLKFHFSILGRKIC